MFELKNKLTLKVAAFGKSKQALVLFTSRNSIILPSLAIISLRKILLVIQHGYLIIYL